MKKLVVLLILSLSLLPAAVFAAPSVFPHGVTIYKPEKCWNGYTVLSKVVARGPGENPTGYGVPLIDMNGNVVKEWKNVAGYPALILPGGRLLGGLIKGTPGVHNDVVVQLDWDGKVEWSWDKALQLQVKKPDGTPVTIWTAAHHHDTQREPNPVGYYVPNMDPFTSKGKTLLVGKGKGKFTKGPAGFGRIIEVGWDGEILWDWDGTDHYDKDKLRTGGTDTLGGNCAAWLGPNKWFDQGDKRFDPENIIMDNYNDTIFIISKKTGEVVWQVGPDYSKHPQLAKLGTHREEFMGPWWGGFVGGMLHHSHMIPKGLPGEGNILVFNNGLPYSLVTEFNPVTLEIVWEYSGIQDRLRRIPCTGPQLFQCRHQLCPAPAQREHPHHRG